METSWTFEGTPLTFQLYFNPYLFNHFSFCWSCDVQLPPGKSSSSPPWGILKHTHDIWKILSTQCLRGLPPGFCPEYLIMDTSRRRHPAQMLNRIKGILSSWRMSCFLFQDFVAHKVSMFIYLGSLSRFGYLRTGSLNVEASSIWRPSTAVFPSSHLHF